MRERQPEPARGTPEADLSARITQLEAEVARLVRPLPPGIELTSEDGGDAVLVFLGRIRADGIDFHADLQSETDITNMIRWIRPSDGVLLGELVGMEVDNDEGSYIYLAAHGVGGFGEGHIRTQAHSVSGNERASQFALTDWKGSVNGIYTWAEDGTERTRISVIDPDDGELAATPRYVDVKVKGPGTTARRRIILDHNGDSHFPHFRDFYYGNHPMGFGSLPFLVPSGQASETMVVNHQLGKEPQSVVCSLRGSTQHFYFRVFNVTGSQFSVEAIDMRGAQAFDRSPTANWIAIG